MSLDIELYYDDIEDIPDDTDSVDDWNTVYWANITHNLGTMAEALGIYNCLWHPYNARIETAGDLIDPLKIAINMMKGSPERYKKFDAPNKWDNYDDFLPWLERLLVACEKHQNAKIRVSI